MAFNYLILKVTYHIEKYTSTCIQLEEAFVKQCTIEVQSKPQYIYYYYYTNILNIHIG